VVGELQGAERSGIVGSHGQALVRRDASPVAVVRRYDFGLTCEGRAGIEPAREPLTGPSAYQRPGPARFREVAHWMCAPPGSGDSGTRSRRIWRMRTRRRRVQLYAIRSGPVRVAVPNTCPSANGASPQPNEPCAQADAGGRAPAGSRR
jgi:hypothetical protein